MLPIPFTIATGLLMVAFSMSKLQYGGSNIILATHAILGLFETATLIWTFIAFIQLQQQHAVYFILFLVALSLIATLNIFALMVQTPLLLMDSHFGKWKNKKQNQQELTFNGFFFYLVTLISLLTNYKFKIVLFSGLFNFDCLKCKLESVRKFRLFNVFSFLGLLPQILTLYCAIVLISSIPSSDSFFMILLDTIIIFLLNILFSLFSTKKDDNFFEEEVNGMPIYKVVTLGEQQFQSSNQIGGKSGMVSLGALQDIIQLDQMGYMSTKREDKRQTKANLDQDSKKISECTQYENTVTNSQSQVNEDHIPAIVTSAVVAVQQIQQIEKEQKAEANILMIDEVYDFQTERPREQTQMQQNYEVERLRMIVDVEKRLETPLKTEKSQEEFRQDQREQIEEQSENTSNHQSSGQKNYNKKVGLAQYLQSIQKEDVLYKIQMNAPKYDKIPTIQATQINQPQKQLQKHSISQKQEQLPQSSLQSKPILNLRLKSQPATKQAKQNPSPSTHELQNYQNCQKINKSIKKIVSIHNSPSKVIISGRKTTNTRATKYINRNKTISNTKVNINEDHDQKPVESKSRQKLTIVHNSPIKNKKEANHPLKSHRTGRQSQSDEEDRKSMGRSHLMKRKIQTETQPQSEEIRNTVNKIKQKQKIEDSDQLVVKTKRVSSQKNQITVTAGQAESQDQKATNQMNAQPKQFKRSHHIINTIPLHAFQTVQSQQKSKQIAPMQPYTPSPSKLTNKRKPKKRLDTEISTTSFIRMFAPNTNMNRSPPDKDKSRAYSSVDRRRAKRQLSSFDNLKCEDRRRMKSLEKIYLQRQSKQLK